MLLSYFWMQTHSSDQFGALYLLNKSNNIQVNME